MKFTVVSSRKITEDHSFLVYNAVEMVRQHILEGMRNREVFVQFDWVDKPFYQEHMIEGRTSKTWGTFFFADPLKYDAISIGALPRRSDSCLQVAPESAFHREIFLRFVKPRLEELLKSLGMELADHKNANRIVKMDLRELKGVDSLLVKMKREILDS